MRHHKDKDTLRRYEFLLTYAKEHDTTPPSLFEGYPEDAPEYLFWYIDCFFRLSTSRTTTMGGLWYIPLSEILNLAQFYKLSQPETERFIDYMQTLDREYVEFMNPEDDKPSTNADKSKKSINR